MNGNGNGDGGGAEEHGEVEEVHDAFSSTSAGVETEGKIGGEHLGEWLGGVGEDVVGLVCAATVLDALPVGVELGEVGFA